MEMMTAVGIRLDEQINRFAGDSSPAMKRNNRPAKSRRIASIGWQAPVERAPYNSFAVALARGA